MAMRNIDPEDGNQKEGSSAVAGLAPYWNDPQGKPSIEWKKWSNLFAVAMTAKIFNPHPRCTENSNKRHG